MLLRYLKVLGGNVALTIIVIALVVISSVTKGTTASVTAVIAGILMILGSIRFIIWLVKTPVKKSKDEGA